MPSLNLHTAPTAGSRISPPNPLPPLIQTPSGLAIIEIQGRLNIAGDDESAGAGEDLGASAPAVAIGRLEFPLLSPSADSSGESAPGSTEGPWSKKAHLYIGQNQRLVGEVKRLAKPLAVVRRRDDSATASQNGTSAMGLNQDVDPVSPLEPRGADQDLEIVEIVKWKLFFGGRPEFV